MAKGGRKNKAWGTLHLYISAADIDIIIGRREDWL